MLLSKRIAHVLIAAFLLQTASPLDAAKAKNANGVTIHGMVMHKKKGVGRAHVHLYRHHKRRSTLAVANPNVINTKAAAKVQVNAKAQPKVAGAKTHHGVMTAADGSFKMTHRHAGTVLLVAHKKHVGKGHARVHLGKNGSASVMIRLHKHHHHHS